MSDQTEIEAVRALLVAKARPVGWTERRQRINEVGAVWPIADDIRTEPADIDGLAAEWSIAPGSDPSRVLLYFHGGGYCSGSIVSHRRLVTESGRAAGIRTLAIAYRLAPEHPFPAASEDARTAWQFLLDQGIAPDRIAIGGDSAGGGLTLGLLTSLRDAKEPLPACGWLLSPWTDLTLSGATLVTRDAVDPLIHTAYLQELVDSYLPHGFDRRDPRVSPLFADLAGLSPLLVQVGADETLLADSTRLVEAAGAAEVAVTLEIWPHMIHAFPMWNAHLDAGRRALVSSGSFMRRHLGNRARSP
ncbi:alpha/beta hydrolase [Kaistia algarum]|uniref:alpha/beta hydrolase n=1 Tax=Kaistia algarum TaxID=2083279 RepID=UPI000CE77896|nr:alpha/beta hydrolase [Kaistia algarum]MCX5515044.1 alpha/beta hydrolase [Kaistia algarum]PPE79780.1 alpha/beta hydrolase [Kaistia algarum]